MEWSLSKGRFHWKIRTLFIDIVRNCYLPKTVCTSSGRRYGIYAFIWTHLTFVGKINVSGSISSSIFPEVFIFHWNLPLMNGHRTWGRGTVFTIHSWDIWQLKLRQQYIYFLGCNGSSFIIKKILNISMSFFKKLLNFYIHLLFIRASKYRNIDHICLSLLMFDFLHYSFITILNLFTGQ